MFSNIRINDCITSNEAYAKRAVELGHGIISTAEHGWQGPYYQGRELADEYGLKHVFGAEAYWVRDRAQKDRSNCHIFLAAKNENGRQAINDILSEACLTGFYGQPRVDIPLLLTLPPDDVIVTTACAAYWRYDDIEDITLRFKRHFRHFYLEVQYHNTPLQNALNARILDISKRHGIPIIMGCDSHFIHEAGTAERQDFLNSKGMAYGDEEGWYLDYPTGEEAYKRFAAQCVLGHDEIMQAMRNTEIFLSVEPYENPCFTKDIKMPSLYPALSQDEKDTLYRNLVWKKWTEEKKNVPREHWGEYEAEIAKEIDIVITTKHADYFLLDYEIVKRGKELGGVITPSGRGSGVSFYVNKLLGFTDVDRIAALVKMYPERFMSPTRILEAKTLADLDLNLANPEVFAQAQIDVLGEGHSYPMIAYGTMQPKAAFKMYAKSQNVAFNDANAISAQIDKYEKALRHASEDDRESVQVIDYIEPRYREIYRQSEAYRGVTVSASIHPCSYLLYQGDVRREIGLTRAKDKIVTVMDGAWAEAYKFLKNDLLKVSVVDLIDRVYKRIGKPWQTIRELLAACPPDSAVWDVYKKGCTIGINQVEQDGTRHRAMKYAPTNISELCAFVAAIRPGFASMYRTFERREPFKYGIPSLDKLIQTPEMPHSFILYQEISMAVLHYAGIPMSECYEIIKNIAKKRVEKVLHYKEQFMAGFTATLMEQEKQPPEAASGLSEKVWQILEDSSRYSFNASHSYSVAVDSLYGAYLKTHYPLQFYECLLRLLDEKGDKARMAAAKNEAESYFQIKFPPFRYGQDNRAITADERDNSIRYALTSVKGYGAGVCATLYECGQHSHESFIDVLLWLDKRSIKSAKVAPLVRIGYFERFGGIPALLRILEIFDAYRQGKAKEIKKDSDPPYIHLLKSFIKTDEKSRELKIWRVSDCAGFLKACEKAIRAEAETDMSYKSVAQSQMEILGYVDLTTGKADDLKKLFVTRVVPLIDQNTGAPWGYRVYTKSLGRGKSAALTVRARAFRTDPIKPNDILDNIALSKRGGYWYLDDYKRIY